MSFEQLMNVTPKARMSKSQESRTSRKILRYSLYQHDEDLINGTFHNQDDSWSIEDLSKVAKPIIQELLGDDYEDNDMPGKCFALCKDIMKKRRNYLIRRTKENEEGKTCFFLFLDWSNLDWSNLDWSNLDWSNLDWSNLCSY